MGSPALFQGTFVKFLKAKLNLFDVAYILTDTNDPRVVATNAPKGSLLLRQGTNGQVFMKLDAGTTTNWKLMLNESSTDFADELKETFKNMLENSYFDALSYNIFRIDGNGKLDGSTTATYDVTTDSVRFTAGSQILVSTALLDADFLSSNRDVDSVSVAFQWVLGLIDTAATYEVSRDGGAHYQTITMARISSSNDTYTGSHDFTAEQDTANQSFATTTTPVELTNVAGTNEQLAQKFEILVDTTINQASLWLSKVDSGTLAGNYRLKLVAGEYLAAAATYANATAGTGTQVIAAGASVGQTFTTAAGNPNYVNSITVRLRNPSSNTEVQPIRLYLYATSGGNPTGTPIAVSDTILYVNAIPAVNTDYSFQFTTPVRLEAGTVYAWAVQSYATATPNLDMPTTNTSTFAGGNRFTISNTGTTITPTAGEDMTNFSVNYETRPMTPSSLVVGSTDWLSAPGLTTSAVEHRIDVYTKLQFTTYFVVIETDDAYKASYSTTVRAVRAHGVTAGGDGSAYRQDGGLWTSIASAKLAFNTYGTSDAPDISLVSHTTWTNTDPLQNTGLGVAYSEKFTISTSAKVVDSFTVGLDRTGTPTGSLRFRIVRDSAGVPSLVAADTLWTGSWLDLASIYDGNLSVDVGNLILTVGSYHLVVETDATYQAQMTSLRSFAVRIATAGGSGGFCQFDGSVWATVGAGAFDLTMTMSGRALDLRLRVTSSVGSVETYGYGVFYDRPTGLLATGIKMLEVFNFKQTDNQNEFTVTKFKPDPDLLEVVHCQTGQTWRYPAFDIQGQKIIFDANFFGGAGESGAVTLIFDQTRGGSFDNSDSNASLLAANHMGSTDTTIDKSKAGRGGMWRSYDGTLYEAVIKDGGAGWDFYQVTP